MEKSSEMSDREIQEAMLERLFTNSKHLRRISNNLIFFFWLIILPIIIWPIILLLTAVLGVALY